MAFTAGQVTIDLLEGHHDFRGVPTSQWHGDRLERVGSGVLANVSTPDGLRAQLVLVKWPEANEVSLRLADRFGGPSDYERLEDAGEISPRLLGDKLVARIRALRYGGAGRATSAAIEWGQIDAWCGGDARAALADLGATRTGSYGDLHREATRFKLEPAVEVREHFPAALFAIYALTRIMPIMTGFGKGEIEGPHA